jgi:hypothetical protein
VEIPKIRSQTLVVSIKQRERYIDVYGSTTKDLRRMHMDHCGSPDPPDDHLSVRVLGNVCSVLKPLGNALKRS